MRSDKTTWRLLEQQLLEPEQLVLGLLGPELPVLLLLEQELQLWGLELQLWEQEPELRRLELQL